MSDWFEAEQRAERAQKLCESHRWAEALAEIDAALAVNPDQAIWQAQRGFVLEELGRWEEAAESYGASLVVEPGDREVMLAQSSVLLRLERFTQALAVLDEIARLFPDCEPAYCQRIQAYTELGRHDRAEEMFYLAQQINDSCPHCFYAIGVSLAARGRRDKAIFCWKRVLEIEPDYYGVNLRIAEAYRAVRNYDQAREYLLREVRGDPGNTELLFDLAELTLESGQAASAAAKFSQIIELDPTHYESHFALGKVWLDLGQPKRAVGSFLTVTKLASNDPGLPGFHRKYGEAMLALGKFRDARRRLRRATEEDPTDPTVAMLLADCLLAEEKPATASDWYRRVLALDANNAFAYHKLGMCQFKQGRHDAGLTHCLRAVELKPDYMAAMHNAIVAQLHLARWKDARAMLRRAVAIDPTYAPTRAIGKRLWRYRMGRFVRKIAQFLGLAGFIGSRWRKSP